MTSATTYHRGSYTVTPFIFSSLRLDGGAMFGSVPKNIWSKKIKADSENCIPLVSRSLLIRGGGRVVLVDLGCGDKWSDKQRAIFAIQSTPTEDLPFTASEVTDVILTHLHFDHAGGVSTRTKDGALELTYPAATHHLQRANHEIATHPSIRERASYLPENVDILTSAKVNLIDGDKELLPGIIAHRIDGHTMGQQWIEIVDERSPIFFPSDLVPTAHHLPLPFIMGYDMCPRESLIERERFLMEAEKRNALVIFQHDRETESATLSRSSRGEFEVRR